MKRITSIFIFLAFILVSPAVSDTPEGDGANDSNNSVGQGAEKPIDPLDLPPEEFFNLDLSVFSPAKKLQKLKNVPSAIYVMTSEDIRRSAATTLIDLFRLVPGIEVARVSAHEWAITARGFNQVFGNKILLLIDGAPVETPIFNGILWENINIPLDTIDRIEFVRGPGAAIWGTRAMNGLINVITKESFTFPHNSYSAGVGNEHQGSVTARAGKVLSERAAVSAYVKADKFAASEDASGNDLDDEWGIVSGHFRTDLKPTNKDSVRVKATASARQADFQLSVPTLSEPFSEERHDERDNHRASLGALWEHDLADDSRVSLEWNNLYEKREDFLLDLSSYYSDLEFRHRLSPFGANDLTYGLNVRFYTDETEGSEVFRFDPADRSLMFYRGFIHDEISLIEDVLMLTLGSRFEENEQVGFNALPTARLLWSLSDRFSVWGGVSYTTGSPARLYDDIRLNVAAFPEPESGLPAIVQVQGNRDFDSEKLLAYEVGAWMEPLEKLYASVTGFYFRYDDYLSANHPGTPEVIFDEVLGPYLLIPLPYDNEISADSIGAEVALDWELRDWINLSASYSYFLLTAQSVGMANAELVEDNPRNSFSVRSHIDVLPTVELDGILRWVDTARNSAIGRYAEVDLRLAWLFRQNMELELIGRNLLDKRHDELGALVFSTPLSEISRSVFLRLGYTF
ncbi:MAG: TonB-dependent receptor [Deltaproteobacteria bacterium]|nr:TonB-dependent receptor [Deltaproteobacteria bacterium]